MTEGPASAGTPANDVRVAVLFSTRLPFASGPTVTGADLARASWALPLAGALVGGIGAVVYWLSFALGLAPFICATLTVAATLLVTGGLHEDGLADTADGFGGGASREQKLDILRDSRIGSFGACALVLSILLRVGSLTVLAEPAHVAPALIAAHVAARAMLPIFMRATPPARAEGLSAAAGRPAFAQAVIAGCIGATALAFALPRAAAMIAALLLLAAIAGLSRLSMRQIGGQTGDVIGAAEQIGECLVLLVASGA
jgi:adenosylcobinamide-GDP ribazoletransferase